ncbi:YHS domain-containing (seleno)protein [Arenicella sp. 4NH20-0111]|uniref:YHS domain-containing (seleno)protein n=1 Tax=Arenicella sp. 4NH20-0111 TaxID=3127648 RepID=UPI0031066AC5
MKKIVGSLLAVLSFTVSFASFAIEPIYTSFFSNDAIKGYDTVAYFTEGKPVEGSAEYSHKYKGANWLFSSQENLDLFKAAPEKYEPQYGGYCAYAVSQNQTASIKPELFTIEGGKLYLNYSKSINSKWLKDKTEYIKTADENWPSLLAN